MKDDSELARGVAGSDRPSVAAGGAAVSVAASPHPLAQPSSAGTALIMEPKSPTSEAQAAAIGASPPFSGGPTVPCRTPQPSSSGRSSRRGARARDCGSLKSSGKPSSATSKAHRDRSTDSDGVADGHVVVSSPGEKQRSSQGSSPGEKQRSSQGSRPGEKQRSSQGSRPATPVRKVSAGTPSVGTTTSAGAAGTPPRVPVPSDEDPTAREPPTLCKPASPAGGGVGEGGGAAAAVTRQGATAAPARTLDRPDASRSDVPLKQQPLGPLPVGAGGAVIATSHGDVAAAAAVAAVATAPDGRPANRMKSAPKRGDSSSSATISSPAAEVLVSSSSIDGTGVGTQSTGAAAAPASSEGAWERQVSLSESPVGATAGTDPAATASKLALRSPRGSSGSGCRDGQMATSPLLPFRPPSGSQQPPSPGQSSQQRNHQQQSPAQSPQNSQKQRPQQQQQQHGVQNRAVHFSGQERPNSGVGGLAVSPVKACVATHPTAPAAPSHRRISDSSSHVTYGSPIGALTAEPPPLGLLHRRPSNDATGTAAGLAAGSRRDRSMRPGSGEPPSSPIMWALPSATPSVAARPLSGCSIRHVQRPSADGLAAAAAAAAAASPLVGPARCGGGASAVLGARGASNADAAAAAAAAAAGGVGILRAAQLAPLSMPGGLGGALRDALARAAATNVAHLASGALLPEPDFGYARVVEQHRRQKHRQDQLQMHLQLEQQLQLQRSPVGAHTERPNAPPRRSAPSKVDSSKETAAAVARGALPGEGPGGGPSNTSVKSPPPPAAPAPSGPSSSRSSSFSHPSVPRSSKPPLAAKSTRTVLKVAPLHGGSGGGGGNDSDGSPAPSEVAAPLAARTHRSPGALATTSYRFLGLGRRSSKASATDSDGENLGLSLAATVNGGGGGVRGGVGGVAASGATADPDPMGFLAADNVEIRIHCLTFNMGGVVPATAVLPESLFSGSYLTPDAAADAAHLYVFATQESGPLTEWEAAVGTHLGRHFVRVAAESLMSIHILLFAVRPMAPYISEVKTSSVATGVGNVLGNKGGVAVRFTLLGARILLVGAHFAAHDQNVERRNADFHRICAGLFEQQQPQQQQQNAEGAAAGGGVVPRSVQATPERQRGGGGGGGSSGAEGSGTASGPLVAPGSPPRSSQHAGGGSALSRNGTLTPRRTPLGPTLSRFSRGQAGVTFGLTEEPDGGGGPAAADPVGDGGGDEDGGSESQEGAVAPSRKGLTRALSTSSVCSVASNTLAVPASQVQEAALRGPARLPSFWGGVSFNTAQRRSSALLNDYDVVLWMGDLNYRIAGTPEVVKYAIDENMVEVLWANDQLQKQQKKGKVLQGFQEMPIAFAPTFKFARGTDEYDLRRSPSWTDRVLYLVRADPLFADLRPLYYMSVPELRTSDHKPVIAGFELSICPQHAGDNRHAQERGCVIS